MTIERFEPLEPVSAYDQALRQRDRLRGLVGFVEIADENGCLHGNVAEGIVQLLRDAAEYAAELWETIRRDEFARAEAERERGK